MRVSSVVTFAAVAAVALFIGYEAYDLIYSSFEAPNGLPVCDGSLGKTAAKKAFLNIPAAHAVGESILGFTSVSTIDTSDKRVDCKAEAVLSVGDGTPKTIYYWFTPFSGGRFLVGVALDGIHRNTIGPKQRLP